MESITDQAMTATTAALVALSEQPNCLVLAAARLEDALKLVRQAQTENQVPADLGTMTRHQAVALMEAARNAEEWNAATIKIQAAFGGSFPFGLDVKPNFGGFVLVRKRKNA